MDFVLDKEFYEKEDITKIVRWISQATDNELKLYIKDSIFYSSVSVSIDEPGRYHERHQYTLILTAIASSLENKKLAKKYIDKRKNWYINRDDKFLMIPSISAGMSNEYGKLSNTETDILKQRIAEYTKVNEVPNMDKFGVDMISHANIDVEISHLGYIPQNEMILTLRADYPAP